MRSFRFALALLLAAPVAVRAQEKITIAVMPLSATLMGDAGAQANLAVTLRDMLITEFGTSLVIRPIERREIDELLRNRALPLSGQLKDDDAKIVGQLLGAEYWVGGGLIVAGSDARMDLRLVHTETSEITNTFKERQPKDEVLDIVEAIAARFSTDLKVRPKVADIVVPVPSLFAYTRGLDYEKRGERRKAAEMYESALKLFPDNAAAKVALDRVK